MKAIRIKIDSADIYSELNLLHLVTKNVYYSYHKHWVMQKRIGGGKGGDSPQINVPFQSPALFLIIDQKL